MDIIILKNYLIKKHLNIFMIVILLLQFRIIDYKNELKI